MVLKYDIVVPSAFHGKVFGVEQRVTPSNINFTLLFLFGSSFGLLLGFSCSTLLSDLLELPLKGSFAVFIAVTMLVEHSIFRCNMNLLIVATLLLTTAIVRIYIPELFK